MNRRLFTKAAGVSMLGALAGCTSVGPDSEDDEEGADDDAATSDEDATDEPAEADDEQDGDEQTDDEQEDDEDEQTDDEQDGDEQEDDGDEQTDDEQDGDEQTDDEQEDDDQADDGEDDDDQDQDDGSPEDDEMSAEISMDTELEEFLDVVHHEFSWESGEGSHLCNINLEVQNASADGQIQFEAIGEIVSEDGAVLAGDRTRFLLDPEETGTFTFSVDQCADATGYQLTFNAEYVPTDSE